MRRKISESLRWQIIGYCQGGATQKQAARRFGVSQGEISKLIRKWNQTGGVVDRRRSGRPRKTNQRQDRHLLRLARQNRFMSAMQLRNTWRQQLGYPISRETTNKRLLQAGYRARRPIRRPLLTQRHRAARLRWATYRQHWNARTWNRVLWSDESKFNLFMADGRMRVRRLQNEAYRDDCIVPRVQGGGGSVLVWGCFSYHGKLQLHVWDERITGISYRDQIINGIIRPHFIAHPNENFIFVDDNAPVHRAHVVQRALADAGIPRMEWPANSPDLNIIEHAWEMLGRAIQNRNPPIQTIQDLRAAIVDEWNQIPLQKLRRLITSCSRRCRAVIASQGGHTRY